jgi:L-asparagine transporter-like permease
VSDTLRRDLNAAQLSMIAIGGAIGTGLFLGSGFAIGLAGPAVLVSYALAGLVTLALMGALAEMTVSRPGEAGFGAQADRYLGPFGGYLIRWAYLAGVVLAVGTEVTAVAVYMKLWLPQVPGLVWILGFSALLVGVNLAGVAVFGWVEFALSAVKIAAIAAFLVLGSVWLFGTAPADTGLRLYTERGGFAPNGLWGIWVATIVAIFSYFSIEMIAVAAAEAADPATAVVRAFKATLLRLAFFYLGSLALMLAITPWTEAGTGESPFVTVARAIGLRGGADAVNFVVLVAALSAMNSQLYAASRMLWGLARTGSAPGGLGRVDGRGVPARALGAASVGAGVAALVYRAVPDVAFTVMVSIATCGALTTWLLIFLTHLAFRHQEGAPTAFRMPAGRWTSLAGASAVAGLLATTPFTEAFRPTLLAGAPFLLLVAAGYRLRRHGEARSERPDPARP